MTTSTLQSDNTISESPLVEKLSTQPFSLVVAATLFAIFAVSLVVEHSQYELQALTLGVALGLVFFHSSFGFTTAFRRMIVEKRGAGIRAILIMLSLSVLIFFPTLASGELFGNSVTGFVRPLGPSVIFGAFIFGIGMQLASGCASGNLYHLGGGQLRALPAIIGFAGGALWATADYEWWTTLPQLAPVGLIETLGVVSAIALNLALFAAIYLFTVKLEKSQHGALENDGSANNKQPLWRRLIKGPWPLIWGAIGLTVLNFATLSLLGRPWAVALAYPVWGAKAAELLNLNLELDFWTYWMAPGRDEALVDPLLADKASLMNLGVILGAFIAATLSGKFKLTFKMPIRNFTFSLLGGVLLGYGATIAYGCNIGAFVGGVVSGSLHGWLWIISALLGCIVGLKLKSLFRL